MTAWKFCTRTFPSMNVHFLGVLPLSIFFVLQLDEPSSFDLEAKG